MPFFGDSDDDIIIMTAAAQLAVGWLVVSEKAKDKDNGGFFFGKWDKLGKCEHITL